MQYAFFLFKFGYSCTHFKEMSFESMYLDDVSTIKQKCLYC